MGKGGLISAVKRGTAGMRSGYSEARTDRLREAAPKAKQASRFGVAGIALTLLLLGGLAVGAVAIAAPHVFRVRGVQAPVNVTIRAGVLTPNVLRVQNLGQTYLPNVVVSASRPSTGQREARRIESIAPGQVIELGGLEWNWIVRNGDVVEVRADGYLPVVFTSGQMAGQ